MISFVFLKAVEEHQSVCRAELDLEKLKVWLVQQNVKKRQKEMLLLGIRPFHAHLFMVVKTASCSDKNCSRTTRG